MEYRNLINTNDLTSIISKRTNNVDNGDDCDDSDYTIILGKHKINERKLTRKYTRKELGIILIKKKDQTISLD